MQKTLELFSKFLYIYYSTPNSATKTFTSTYDIVLAWKKAYEWILQAKPNSKLSFALNYLQLKINSRTIAYAIKYIQAGHTKEELIEELNFKKSYKLLLNINKNQIIPSYMDKLELFQTNIDIFVDKAKKEANKVRFAKFLLRIPFIKSIIDKRRFPLSKI